VWIIVFLGFWYLHRRNIREQARMDGGKGEHRGMKKNREAGSHFPNHILLKLVCSKYCEYLCSDFVKIRKERPGFLLNHTRENQNRFYCKYFFGCFRKICKVRDAC
jgi:hypothetical protein